MKDMNGWFLRGTWISIAASWLVCTVSATAGDWPMYRGSSHSGISEEVGWISEWGEEDPIMLWQVSVGYGSSSVVIADGRAYTMGNHGQEEDQQQDTVYCFDAANGKTLWEHTYPCPRLPKYMKAVRSPHLPWTGRSFIPYRRWGTCFALTPPRED